MRQFNYSMCFDTYNIDSYNLSAQGLNFSTNEVIEILRGSHEAHRALNGHSTLKARVLCGRPVFRCVPHKLPMLFLPTPGAGSVQHCRYAHLFSDQLFRGLDSDTIVHPNYLLSEFGVYTSYDPQTGIVEHLLNFGFVAPLQNLTGGVRQQAEVLLYAGIDYKRSQLPLVIEVDSEDESGQILTTTIFRLEPAKIALLRTRGVEDDDLDDFDRSEDEEWDDLDFSEAAGDLGAIDYADEDEDSDVPPIGQITIVELAPNFTREISFQNRSTDDEPTSVSVTEYHAP